MSVGTTRIVEHYSRSRLAERLDAALREDGVDPLHPSVEALAPYDQFHGRGVETTEDIAAMVAVVATDHLLDIGSGIGGPARWFATRFGCRVTGIDLTPEFCAVARELNGRLGLGDRVRIEEGDALAMPFPDASFDGAYSMYVSMNIADKERFYREIARVLRPGAWLALSEIAQGPRGELQYPVPWAAHAGSSFLATPEETLAGLQDAGFGIERFEDTLEQALAFGAKSRAMVERGEKPPYRALTLVHDALARSMAGNVARGYQQGSIVPIEIVARKR
jgi:ubiquinone/menaquinone biosynthesis C-methylase UbiE